MFSGRCVEKVSSVGKYGQRRLDIGLVGFAACLIAAVPANRDMFARLPFFMRADDIVAMVRFHAFMV